MEKNVLIPGTQILNRYSHLVLPEAISQWMADPSNNWNLLTTLLKHVMSVTKRGLIFLCLEL
jgi:hypothetical protein